jgi:N-acetylmuramoyl-L-alanine amidase
LKARRSIVKGVSSNWKLLENPMRSANFAVLRAPDVPSILIETGFLSNHHDERLLATPGQRQKIAALLAREIVKLLASPPFA